MGFWRNYDFGKWIYGMWAAIIGGGANAVVNIFGLSIQDPKDFNMQTGKFYNTIATLFITGAVVNFFMYLKQHNAPEPIVTKEVTTTVHTVEKTEPAPSNPK